MEEMKRRLVYASLATVLLNKCSKFYFNSKQMFIELSFLFLISMIFELPHLQGNVEIFHDGQWGTICDDEWDLYEAKIG